MYTVNKVFASERERVRDLAKAYFEYAVSPGTESRRNAWSEHNALHFTRPLIYIRAIPFHEFFDYSSLKCSDGYLRGLESMFLQRQYHSALCDDYIEEPYMTVRADLKSTAGEWGLPVRMTERPIPGGAAAYDPVMIEEDDIKNLKTAPHEVNEKTTKEKYDRMSDLLGDIMPVYMDRQGILCGMWSYDISTTIAKLRGLEQIMWDAYDRPEWLHKLLSFMRDRILLNMDQTEESGDFSFVNHQNQAMPYCRGMTRPGGGKAGQNELWGYMAAQEYTTFSPGLFKEFMFDYQKPILERFRLIAYGCCEDLTNKIDIIKELKNLRRIGVSPFADLRKCAERIGGDYILSWRPNPSDMVSTGVDEEYVRGYIRRGIAVMKEYGCKYDITLKDVETVSGDAGAIVRWTEIVRDEINRAY